MICKCVLRSYDRKVMWFVWLIGLPRSLWIGFKFVDFLIWLWGWSLLIELLQSSYLFFFWTEMFFRAWFFFLSNSYFLIAEVWIRRKFGSESRRRWIEVSQLLCCRIVGVHSSRSLRTRFSVGYVDTWNPSSVICSSGARILVRGATLNQRVNFMYKNLKTYCWQKKTKNHHKQS